jgi:hypothetical protein
MNGTLNLMTDSWWPTGSSVVWTNAPAGLGNVTLSGDYRTFGFAPSHSAPTSYVVTAWSSLLPTCMDTATARVWRVEIVPTNALAAWNTNAFTLQLTNSYWDGSSVIWTSTPAGLSPAGGAGATFTVNPSNSVPTNYTITACIAGMTNCATTAQMSVIKVDVAPHATNVYWWMTNEVTIVVSNSYASGGIIWSGTNGLHVISACDTQLVFKATNSVPGDYIVKAAAAVLSDAYDTATVGIRKADIVQTQVGWSVGLFNNAPFNLTADSSMNVTWTIAPNLGAGGAQFAAGPNVPGTASTGSGTNVWITPGTTATNYTITAYVNDLPSCQDTAKLIVISNYTVIACSTFIALSNNCVTATAWAIDASGVAVPTNSNWTIPLGNTRARFVSGASTVTSTTGVDTVTLTGLVVSATVNDVRVHAVAVGSPMMADDEWFSVIKVDLDVDGLSETDEDMIGGLVVRNYDSNNASRKKITVQKAEPNIWNGNVVLTHNSTQIKVFTASTGGSEISFNGTDNKFANTVLPKDLYIEGTQQSVSIRDVHIKAEVEGISGCEDSVSFTVMWVEMAPGKHAGAMSADNAFTNRYFTLITVNPSRLDLGPGEFIDRFGRATEFRGDVFPTNFVPSIFGVTMNLARTKDVYSYYSNSSTNGTNEYYHSTGDDTSLPTVRDDDPQSDGSAGKIYDCDAPGIPKHEFGDAVGSIRRYRGNFHESATAVIGGVATRCSGVQDWYSKQSWQKSSNTWVQVNDVANDNANGDGQLLKQTWNMQ